jgi:hypothetical protein
LLGCLADREQRDAAMEPPSTGFPLRREKKGPLAVTVLRASLSGFAEFFTPFFTGEGETESGRARGEALTRSTVAKALRPSLPRWQRRQPQRLGRHRRQAERRGHSNGATAAFEPRGSWGRGGRKTGPRRSIHQSGGTPLSSARAAARPHARSWPLPGGEPGVAPFPHPYLFVQLRGGEGQRRPAPFYAWG